MRENFNSVRVPATFREVVGFCADNNVFWPFLDIHVGHFACKVGDTLYSSFRHDNHNQIRTNGFCVSDATGMNVPRDCVLHFHREAINELANTYTEVNGLAYVYFPDHGPNIYFDNDSDPSLIVNFIKENFNLTLRTKGLDHVR